MNFYQALDCLNNPIIIDFSETSISGDVTELKTINLDTYVGCSDVVTEDGSSRYPIDHLLDHCSLASLFVAALIVNCHIITPRPWTFYSTNPSDYSIQLGEYKSINPEPFVLNRVLKNKGLSPLSVSFHPAQFFLAACFREHSLQGMYPPSYKSLSSMYHGPYLMDINGRSRRLNKITAESYISYKTYLKNYCSTVFSFPFFKMILDQKSDGLSRPAADSVSFVWLLMRSFLLDPRINGKTILIDGFRPSPANSEGVVKCMKQCSEDFFEATCPSVYDHIRIMRCPTKRSELSNSYKNFKKFSCPDDL